MYLNIKNKIEIILYKFFKLILVAVFKRNGDVLPLYLLKKLDKNLIDNFSRDINAMNIPVIFVTGTNGKTTTANLIASGLNKAGMKVCSNINGANMANGIFGSIIERYSCNGKFNADIMVIETDEKVFPYIISKINPALVVITNFYRDQLDRYGEVNTTMLSIKKSIQSLKTLPVLILPSNEPLASFVGFNTKNKKFYFNVKSEKKELNSDNKNNNAHNNIALTDAISCPQCGNILSAYFNAHYTIVNYCCNYCGYKNAAADIEAESFGNDCITFNFKNIEEFNPEAKNKYFNFKPSIQGYYNILNYMAAFLVLKFYCIDDEIIKKTFENYSTKFGRSFKKIVQGIECGIDLVKNPSGFNNVLEKIFEKDDCINALFAFSDRDADGRDVSWIWDVNFEKYVSRFNNIIITGLRPYDMAIRFKTAGIDIKKIKVNHRVKEAFNEIINLISNDNNNKDDNNNKKLNKLYIFSTYTELSNLEKIIV